MENKRKLIRLKVTDFLEIRSLNEVAKCFNAVACDFTPMGICFSSQVEWKKGNVLLIDYFIQEEFESVKLKVAVVWSEFIDIGKGYFCGAQIVEIEPAKREKFIQYYSQRLNDNCL
jgi:hypothetical protein